MKNISTSDRIHQEEKIDNEDHAQELGFLTTEVKACRGLNNKEGRSYIAARGVNRIALKGGI